MSVEHYCNIVNRKELKNLRKLCASATVSTNGLGSNTCLRSERPVTTSLSHGTPKPKAHLNTSPKFSSYLTERTLRLHYKVLKAVIAVCRQNHVTHISIAWVLHHVVRTVCECVSVAACGAYCLWVCECCTIWCLLLPLCLETGQLTGIRPSSGRHSGCWENVLQFAEFWVN